MDDKENRKQLLNEATLELNTVIEQVKKISQKLGSSISIACHPDYAYINFIHDERFIGEDETINGIRILRTNIE